MPITLLGLKYASAAARRRVVKEDNVLSLTPEAAAMTAASVPPLSRGIEDPSSDSLLTHILASLDTDKAEDVVAIDLRGRTEMADHMVIATGRSSRQVAAIAEKLTERLKADCGVSCKIEGKEHGDWVLIDAGDAIVHLFRPEVREFYQLEKMWMPSGASQA